MLQRICAALLLIAASGCGDTTETTQSEETASTFEGLWLISSITIPDQGALITIRRDGTPRSLRGDALFTATGATTGTLDVRQVLLDDGRIASPVQHLVNQVTIEPAHWVVTTADGGVTVFWMGRTADHLTLTLDTGDPRTTAKDPPVSIIVDRVVPWTTSTVGRWALEAMNMPDRVLIGGACTEVEPGKRWATVAMDITFEPRLLFTRTMTVRTFDDAGCTSLLATTASDQTGFVEEDAGGTLRMWGIEKGETEYLELHMHPTASGLVLIRAACLPMPECDASAPTMIVVRPVSR